MLKHPLPLFLTFIGSVFILGVAAAVAIVGLREAGTLLVIHFDAFRGIDFLGTTADVFEMVGIGGILVVLNALLAAVLYPRARTLAYLLGSASALIGVLILIAVGVIVTNN